MDSTVKSSSSESVSPEVSLQVKLATGTFVRMNGFRARASRVFGELPIPPDQTDPQIQQR